jgi:hypothetical protein
MNHAADTDPREYTVVIDHEEQDSIRLLEQALPPSCDDVVVPGAP